MPIQKIFRTTPASPFEFPIFIPRDMDLPFSVQLYDPGEDCDSEVLTPYNTTGHQFVFEIFSHKESEVVLLSFPNADWDTFVSEGQDGTAIPDIVGRTFLWSEWQENGGFPGLTLGKEYWFRFRGIDVEGVDFLIGRGPFELGRY